MAHSRARLVSELRLAGASTLEEANEELWEYLPCFNIHFGVPAAQPGSAYRKVTQRVDLEGVLCFKYQPPWPVATRCAFSTVPFSSYPGWIA